jgi:uncharacterized protein (TIGR02145 family)
MLLAIPADAQLMGGQLKNRNNGLISILDCSTIIFTGTLIEGVSTNASTISINYSGGNGGYYGGQSIFSSVVNGLVARLDPGSLSYGSGILTLTIEGTPSSSGTAYFSLNIGGETCLLSAAVQETNSDNAGAACGSLNIHNPNKNYGLLIDQEGNIYKTIIINSQEWMAENLRTSTFNNGSIIPNIIENMSWANATTPAWCYNNNNVAENCPHGKLYNWYTINTTQNICPVGWHVPSDTELQTLVAYYSNSSAKLRSSGVFQNGSGYWSSSAIVATNESGFSLLPSGFRNASQGIFLSTSTGADCEIWTSTSSNSLSAWAYSVFYNIAAINRYSNPYKMGCSIRCLKDY